jgi:phage I-like protein
MFMPAGRHQIHPSQGGKPITIEVQVDRASAAALQKQLECVRARGPHRAYMDFNHEDSAASFWPEEFIWRDAPAAGIHARGQWSAAGEAAITGKTFRAFSPVFHVDDVRGQPARIVCCDEPGLNFGGLVNKPAFQAIAPMWAKDAGEQRNQNQNHTDMTPEQLAALQASIKTMETELTALKAKGADAATQAELNAKQSELAAAQARAETEELRAKNTALEAAAKTRAEKEADAAIELAVQRGAIAARDEASKGQWKKNLLADAANIVLLAALAPAAPLQAGRITPAGGVQEIRAASDAVIKALGGLQARQTEGTPYHERLKHSREFAALYAKEITPRLREGDDIPLLAANSFGTLSQTLVSTRILELLTLDFPTLNSIATDFSDQIVSFGDSLKTRIVGIPTVSSYNQTTGWTDSDMNTTDVSITYDQFKGVPIKIDAQSIASTVRRLFDEIAPAQAYALGKDMVDYLYALITAAFTNPVIAAGLGTFGRATVVDMGGTLDDTSNPSMGRTLILNRPYFSALEKDPTIVNLATFQRADILTMGMQNTLKQIAGFNTVIKAVNFPSTAIGVAVLKGFAYTKSALCLATRLSADYVNVLPGSSSGNLTVITTPGGMSANQIQFTDHKLGAAYQRLELIYGANRGQVAAGVLLTDV